MDEVVEPKRAPLPGVKGSGLDRLKRILESVLSPKVRLERVFQRELHGAIVADRSSNLSKV